MKKLAGLIAFFLFLTGFQHADAQNWKLRRYEGSIGLAATSFYSDVGKSIDNESFFRNFTTMQPGTVRPTISAAVRYKINGYSAARLNLSYGYLHGKDGGNLENRQYVMTTTIFEPSLVFEYYLLPESRPFTSNAIFNRRGMINNYSRVYVYLFGGAGGVLYNPKAKEGIETDPRFDPIRGVTAVFPGGAGIKLSIDANWSFGFEFGRRFTFTDKLDGITTQTSQKYDIYDFAVFSAIYKVRTDRRGRPVFNYGYNRRR